MVKKPIKNDDKINRESTKNKSIKMKSQDVI